MFQHNRPTWCHIEKAVILQRKRKVLNACQEYPGISKSIYEKQTIKYAKKTSHLKGSCAVPRYLAFFPPKDDDEPHHPYV